MTTSQRRTHRRLGAFLATLALLSVIVGAERVTTGTAAAASPCWEQILTDWSDGAITGLYPVGCYRQALRALPEDVRLYSTASDDIRRALAARVHSSRSLAGAHLDAADGAPATAVTSSGRLPKAPLAVAGALAALGFLTAAGMVVWHRRSRSRTPAD